MGGGETGWCVWGPGGDDVEEGTGIDEGGNEAKEQTERRNKC